MGELLFRFRAGELTHLRIVCKQCGTVVEVSLDRLANLPAGMNCICGNLLQKTNCAYLTQLAIAIKRFAELDYVDVEFSLPSKDTH
jgi:hypothetical protein